MALPSFLKSKRTLIILGIVLALGIAGYYVYSKEDPPKFQTAAVERGTIRSVVGATGTVNAITTVQVGSQVSGTIEKYYVDFNDRVKAGQLVATIEPSLFRAQYEQSEANVKTAEAEQANAQANLLNLQANFEKAKISVQDARIKLDRAKGLFQGELLAKSELDVAQANFDSAVASQKQAEAQIEAAKAQLRSAQARVAQARAQLNLARVNLDHTKIYSPIDGVVVLRNIDVGQTVAASFQAPVLFTIANDLTKMQVYTNIDEADVGRIHENSAATFTVDAFPQEMFRGRIAQIRLNPTTVQNVVTYTAIILVDNPDLKLKPGMTANVTIQVAQRDNVLKIPNAALRFRPPMTESERQAQQQAGQRSRSGGSSISPTSTGPSAEPSSASASESKPQPTGPALSEKPKMESGESRSGAGERDGWQRGGERGAFQGGALMGGGMNPEEMRQRFQAMREKLKAEGLSDDEIRERMRAMREKMMTSSPGQSGTLRSPGARSFAPQGGARESNAPASSTPPVSGMSGGSGWGGMRRSNEQAVYVLDAKGKLNPIKIKTGITDGIYTELLEGSLQEGDRIVVGQVMTSATPTRGQPQMPRAPGVGRGGGFR